MKTYREVKAIERQPKEKTEVHIIENGLLTSGFYQDEQWYLGEHERAVINFDFIWLEPIEEKPEVRVWTSEDYTERQLNRAKIKCYEAQSHPQPSAVVEPDTSQSHPDCPEVDYANVEADRCLKCHHIWTHEDDRCPECGSDNVECGITIKRKIEIIESHNNDCPDGVSESGLIHFLK